MVKRQLNEELFKEVVYRLERGALKEPDTGQYNIRINVGNRLYSLRLQADEKNIIYVLHAAEVRIVNGEETFLPIYKNKKIYTLIEAYIFIILEEDLADETNTKTPA